jgi:hypothetical protein
MKTIPRVSSQPAQAVANYFLSDHLSDRFTADQAQLSGTVDSWQVPVILAYPVIGAVGQVGEIWVSVLTEQVVSHTPVEEMRQAGARLYEAHRHEIEAAF